MYGTKPKPAEVAPTTSPSTDDSTKISGVKEMVEKHFKFVTIGMSVWYWITGEREGQPIAAMVTGKFKSSLSLDLTLIGRGERNGFKTAEGIRHIDDPDYVEFQRKETGAWEPIPADKLLMDLIDHGRR